jgi:hypothetical protein
MKRSQRRDIQLFNPLFLIPPHRFSVNNERHRSTHHANHVGGGLGRVKSCGDVLGSGYGVGVALAFLAIGCIVFLNWYFRLRLQYESSTHIFNLTLLWIAPTVTYLLYHQFTLPTWLTLGYPVSLGGVKRNICDESTADQWPCSIWFLDNTGPGGWKYLPKPDLKVVILQSFVISNALFLRWLLISLCKTRGDDTQPHGGKCSKCGGQLKADIEMPMEFPDGVLPCIPPRDSSAAAMTEIWVPGDFWRHRANVCTNPTLTLGVDPSHDRPCFPAHLKDRVINLAGPDGWRHLIEFDARIIGCIFFLVINIGMLAWFVATARKPHFEEVAVPESYGQSKVDTELSELEDLEKQ